MNLRTIDPTVLTQLNRVPTKTSRKELIKILRTHQLAILKTVPNCRTTLLTQKQRNLLFTIETVMDSLGAPYNLIA